MSIENGVFEYDETQTFQENFHTWYSMNTAERSAYRETPYSLEEAFAVFSKMYEAVKTV